MGMRMARRQCDIIPKPVIAVYDLNIFKIIIALTTQFEIVLLNNVSTFAEPADR